MKPISVARVGFIMAQCLAAGFVFYATGKHPYSYYIITRWVVFIACCWGVIGFRRLRGVAWPIYFAVGITFNPLLPFHFARVTWHNLDIAAGALLLFALAFESRSYKTLE
jgi:hypothetical protein